MTVTLLLLFTHNLHINKTGLVFPVFTFVTGMGQN